MIDKIMNKQSLIYLGILLILNSCNVAKYTFETKSNIGIDFGKGKWLLNEIDCPDKVNSKLTKITIDEFSKYLKDRLSVLNQTKGVLLPNDISTNLNKSTLRDIKNGSGFDYFINIKTEILKKDTWQKGSVDSDINISTRIMLEIYDLNDTKIIYKQSVIGGVAFDPNDSTFRFTKGINDLFIGGLNKIIKKISQNQ
jgi:hypothetical protein